MHTYIFNVSSLKFIVEKKCQPLCISHSLFHMEVLEQIVIIYNADM
jgi:hypothetical protein